MAAIIDYGTAYGATAVAGKRLQLSAEEFVRPMVFGNRWHRIQIGIRFNVGYFLQGTTASPSISNHQFALGFCSGTTNTFSSPVTTAAFVGGPGYGFNGTWNNFSSHAYYGVPGDGSGYRFTWAGLKKGTSLNQYFIYTGSVSNNEVACGPTFYAGGFQYPFYATFTAVRGKPTAGLLYANYGITISSSYAVWTTRYDVLKAMEYESGTTSTGIYNNVDEFDCATINWGLNVPCLELLDIFVVRYE